jgi:hypothetical protein
METDALLLPVAVGMNFTTMLHLAPGATLEPQVFTWAKSPGLLPPTVIPVMLKVVVPTFVSVTVLGWLIVPTF